jgi:hypothetical protein
VRDEPGGPAGVLPVRPAAPQRRAGAADAIAGTDTCAPASLLEAVTVTAVARAYLVTLVNASAMTARAYRPGSAARTVPTVNQRRMLTARPATSTTVMTEIADSESISRLARLVSGIASVGLNAIAFVNET